MGLLERLRGWAGRAQREVCVLVLGLDNSGKTTLLRALRAADGADTATTATTGTGTTTDCDLPTVGHQQDHFQSGGVSFSAWDVSGAARHRALWERHYRRADALLFVVDAADRLRLVVAREELRLAVAHPDVRGRRAPLLVLANKCDLPHALDAHHVAAALALDAVTDRAWHVCAVSARAALAGDTLGTAGTDLRDGVAWLARQLRDAATPTPAHP